MLDEQVALAVARGWTPLVVGERFATLTTGGTPRIAHDTHVLYAVGGLLTCGLPWLAWAAHVAVAGGMTPRRTLTVLVDADGAVTYEES